MLDDRVLNPSSPTTSQVRIFTRIIGDASVLYRGQTKTRKLYIYPLPNVRAKCSTTLVLLMFLVTNKILHIKSFSQQQKFVLF